MRIEFAVKNFMVGIVGQLLTLILGFVTRWLFLMILSVEYLGVSSLFGNILTLLSFADFGIGTAIVYSLYKPLTEKNHAEIRAIMNFFKKIYRIIGIVVFFMGLSLLPFLEFFVSDRKGIANLELIYALFIFNSSSSYFFSYNRSLIVADQRGYVLFKIDYAYRLLNALLPIGILCVFHEYISYLIANISIGIFRNIIVYIRVRREYPLLNDNTQTMLPDGYRRQLIKNISALIIYKLAIVVTAGTDNILLSYFFDISIVGLYANYSLIVTSISALISQGMSAVASSIGNMLTIEDEEKRYTVFRAFHFLNEWVFVCATIMLFVLFGPFISLWLGKKYLLDIEVTVPICLMFYTLGMQSTATIFREAQGLFWQGKLRPAAQVVINLGVSIFLARWTNSVASIFWGTIISRLLTSIWFDPYLVYKHCLHRSPKRYYAEYAMMTMLMVLLCGVIYYLGSLPALTGMLDFLYKVCICVVIPNAVLFILFRKTPEFRYVTINVLSVTKKIVRRKHPGV